MRFCVILCTMLAGLIPCLATLFGIVAFYESRAVELRTAEIQNQCTILSNQLSAYGYLSDPTSEVIDSNLTQLTNIYNGRVMIMDEDLCVIKDTYNLDEGKTNVSESVVRCMRTKPTNHYDKKNHYIEVTSPINIPGKKKIDGVILASVSTDSIEVTKQVFYTHGGVVVGIAAIFLAVFGVALANKLVKPIHKITGAIENVSEGYSDDVLHVDTFAETSQLSEAFNKMLGRLKQLDDSREEFVSNVSHELKTPLAMMMGAAYSLEDKKIEKTPELCEQLLSSILDSGRRMERIIANLLDTARIESGTFALKKEWTDMEDLVSGALRRLGGRIQERILSCALPEDLPLFMGDGRLLEHVVLNLLDNAVKYSEKGTAIFLRAWHDERHIYFAVEDEGIGFKEDDEPYLFEKFYRAAYTDQIQGTGLGLSICKNIVEAHGGSIWAARRTDRQGSQFGFSLPLETEDEV